jgi:hypothetical protein
MHMGAGGSRICKRGAQPLLDMALQALSHLKAKMCNAHVGRRVRHLRGVHAATAMAASNDLDTCESFPSFPLQ